MGKSFFEQGQQRAPKVNALFNQIAPRYDLINDLQSFGLHRYWKRRLIQLGQIRPGAVALDLCCGTGDLAVGMAKQGAQVIGLDFSEEMLKVADRRTNANPIFIRGDALRTPFPDDSFEIVTVGYGLRNLVSWEAGLEEMLRVSKSQGRLLALDFGKPDNWAWRNLYYTYLRLIVPVFGRTFAGSWSAYAYILESLKHYPAQQGVAKHMIALGMQNVRVIELLGGVMSINYGEKG